ncbi:cell division protein FtsX [Bacteroidia bacterium]|nr:cell division protein FtsX [Bacteroidia bacterium]
MILSYLKKSKSLRIVNLIGLSVIFACLVLSYIYIKKEWSYDRFNKNAERMVRFSIQYDNYPVDGRVSEFASGNQLIADIPEIEDVVFLDKINTGVLTYNGKSLVVDDFYFVSSNFFKVFDYKLLQGDGSVLDSPEKALVSERFAKQLFGDESSIGKEIHLDGRKCGERTVFVSGVFENFPETSHFHTDLIVSPIQESKDWLYVYLLLNKHTDVNKLNLTLAARLDELYKNGSQKAAPVITPLTDIHLFSHVQRELEPNGNIYYIYLVLGANMLLLAIVLFNLWLNAGLIFSYNRKFYQLLRLNGASSVTVLKDESLLALVLGGLSIVVGGGISFFPYLHFSFSIISPLEILIISGLFLLLVLFISVLPVITGMSTTLFLNGAGDLRPGYFSLSKVKFMLIAQYCMVMFIVIVGFGISKQMNLVKTSQVGGKENNILVMKEQAYTVKERYDLLKTELLKYPEIESVTASMQLPGTAIRDALFVWKEGESEKEAKNLPLLVVGDDFFSFYKINLLAGNDFQPNTRTFKEEEKMFFDNLDNIIISGKPAEEYVINRRALEVLGFDSPEDAIGKRLHLTAGTHLNYIPEGIIVGVTDDFTYTTIYEESIPMLILIRKMFLHCIMVRLDPDNTQQALATFNRVWNDIFPDYPADYTFLQDVYKQVYHNEWNAEWLVQLFSLLSLIIANLGLIVVMAFIIKRKTKEIGIRKINGASFWMIVGMLNNRFIAQIGLAFLIAVPGAYYTLNHWLENFAHKTALDWWIFVLAGLFVLLISVIVISWQSWRAASTNPVLALKTE